MIRFYICICIFMFAAVAWGKPVQTMDPYRDLRPSYEYEEQRPYEAAASHYITQTPFAAVAYEVVIDADFTTVWARLEKNIDQTGFTLNTANPNTGIITCALETDTPADFVDMGVTTRTFGHEEFVYPTAAATAYKLPYVNKTGDYYKVWRTTALKCLGTIQISALNADRTKVTVSINYVFTLETRYENTAFRKKAPTPEKVTVNFMTNMPQEVNLSADATPVLVTPRSNGTLEAALLNAARL